MLPSLTLAIPFNAGSEYLRRAIESARRQTDSDWRLVVCDDGGEREVEDLVRSWKDPRIGYHRNPSGRGMADNWNRCLELAATDLVTLFHADDELLPNYVALMREGSARHPEAAALYCQAAIIDAASRRRFHFPDAFKRVLSPRGKGQLLRGEEGVRRLLRGNFIFCPTVCYRRRRLKERRFEDHWRFVPDLDLFVRLLMDGETMVGLPQTAYAYRRHSRSETVKHTASLVRFREEAALYGLLEKRLAAKGWHRAARVAARRHIIRLNLAYCGVQDLLRLRIGEAGRKFRWAWCLDNGRLR